MSIGTLALRLAVGGIFAAHGLQKLRGSFGGSGLEGTEKIMAATGMHPAKFNARVVALTETFGGAAIAAGAGTPVAAAGLIAAMTTAIAKVHAKNGPWNSKGGYEFNVALIAALVAIVADGPGAVSIDAIAGRRKWGVVWAVGALGAGVAASFGVMELATRVVVEDPELDEPAVAEPANAEPAVAELVDAPEPTED